MHHGLSGGCTPLEIVKLRYPWRPSLHVYREKDSLIYCLSKFIRGQIARVNIAIMSDSVPLGSIVSGQFSPSVLATILHASAAEAACCCSHILLCVSHPRSILRSIYLQGHQDRHAFIIGTNTSAHFLYRHHLSSIILNNTGQQAFCNWYSVSCTLLNLVCWF